VTGASATCHARSCPPKVRYDIVRYYSALLGRSRRKDIDNRVRDEIVLLRAATAATYSFALNNSISKSRSHDNKPTALLERRKSQSSLLDIS
jgi:hypothetical protein